jgi:sorbitol-specific phosphotransferase system component IIC
LQCGEIRNKTVRGGGDPSSLEAQVNHLAITFFILLGVLIGLILGWIAEQIETHFMTKHLDAAIKAKNE